MRVISMKKTITFNLNSNSQDNEKVGDKGSKFLKSHGFSNDVIMGQVMIIKELVKHGINSGCFNPLRKKTTACIHIAENTITIEIAYPVDRKCCEKLKELDKTIQFIRGYQDPFEAYTLKQKEVSKNSSFDETNGLGLARIAYEENAILDFFISEDNDLFLSAASSLELGSWN
jgi:hypothetical protein